MGDDRVRGLETIGVESVFDHDGRFAPTFLPGTEEVLPADSVILAVGQAADLSLLGEVALEQTPQGTVRVDPITLQTSHPKIWAGGDVAKGPRNLIDAIADGQRAAAAIHACARATRVPRRHARSRSASVRAFVVSTAATTPSHGSKCPPRRPIVASASPRSRWASTKPTPRSSRCVACAASTTSCSTPTLCILCGLCVDICPTDCITIVRADRIGAGAETQSALLLEEDRCIRCALCVNRCPPGALSMVYAREVVRA